MKPSLFVFAMAIFAIVGMGCSGDSPVAPVESSTVSPVNSTGDTDPTTTWVHFYGTVKRANGDLVPGAGVILRFSYGGTAFQQFARLTADSEGEFSYDWNPTYGAIIECTVAGDTEYRTWRGGGYMYFAMTFVPSPRNPYDMDNPY